MDNTDNYKFLKYLIETCPNEFKKHVSLQYDSSSNIAILQFVKQKEYTTINRPCKNFWDNRVLLFKEAKKYIGYKIHDSTLPLFYKTPKGQYVFKNFLTKGQVKILEELKDTVKHVSSMGFKFYQNNFRFECRIRRDCAVGFTSVENEITTVNRVIDTIKCNLLYTNKLVTLRSSERSKASVHSCCRNIHISHEIIVQFG